jgi:ketosteroid isomerase-like protein
MSVMADIEQRVARLEDRAMIEDLVVRYFLAADGDDLTGVGDSFTDDATFSSSGVPNATGRASIVDFIGTARQHMGLTVHTPHYVLCTFHDPDHASGLVGAHLELVLGGQSLLGAVRYEDDYVREPGGWRISRRDMRTIHIAPWAEIDEAFASGLPVRWPGTSPLPSDYPRMR